MSAPWEPTLCGDLPGAVPGRPASLGGYTLIKEIGGGGMAEVYLAKFRGYAGFERNVVIKAVRREFLGNPDIARMFTAEAILSARLNHPNIVRVHDFGVAGGTPYLVMEHVEGWNLERVWLRQRATGRPMPFELATYIVRELCNALAYAHEFRDDEGTAQPVIHRDVSPANIMLARDGLVRLVDFGIAKVTDGASRLTGQVLRGKYGYLSPEQVDFRAADHRVDIFAAGVVLYELLTGTPAFKTKDDRETLDRISAGHIDAPSRRVPDLGLELDGIVLRALAHAPAERFQSAREMSAALSAMGIGSSYGLANHLTRLFDEASPAARPVAARPPRPVVPSARRHPRASSAAADTVRLSVGIAPALRAPPPASPRWLVPPAPAPRNRSRRGRGPLLALDLIALLVLLFLSPAPQLRAVLAPVRPVLRQISTGLGAPLRAALAEVGSRSDDEEAPDLGASGRAVP